MKMGDSLYTNAYNSCPALRVDHHACLQSCRKHIVLFECGTHEGCNIANRCAWRCIQCELKNW